MVNIGDAVVYADSVREEHAALVTDVHSQNCVNVVVVSADKTKYDSYGRQMERYTSVGRFNEAGMNFGNTFRAVDSEKPEYQAPSRP